MNEKSDDMLKRELYQKMLRGKATSLDLVRLSYLKDMITKEQFLDYLEIERWSQELDDQDEMR